VSYCKQRNTDSIKKNFFHIIIFFVHSYRIFVQPFLSLDTIAINNIGLVMNKDVQSVDLKVCAPIFSFTKTEN